MNQNLWGKYQQVQPSVTRDLQWLQPGVSAVPRPVRDQDRLLPLPESLPPSCPRVVCRAGSQSHGGQALSHHVAVQPPGDRQVQGEHHGAGE